MEVNRLLGDEIVYELRIRGLPVQSTVNENRAILRGALRLERDGMGSSVDLSHQLDPQSEIEICTRKLHDISDDILNFDFRNKENEYKRISTRICHLQLRIKRIHASTSHLEVTKDRLLADCFQLLDNLGEMKDKAEGILSQQDSNKEQNAGVAKSSVRKEHTSIFDEDNELEGTIIDHPNLLLPEVIDERSVVREHTRNEHQFNQVTEAHLRGRNSTVLQMGTSLLNELEEIRNEVRQNNEELDALINRDLPINRQSRDFTQIRESLLHGHGNVQVSERVEGDSRNLRQIYGRNQFAEQVLPGPSFQPQRQNFHPQKPNLTQVYERDSTRIPRAYEAFDRNRLEREIFPEPNFCGAYPSTERYSGYVDVSRWRIQFDGNSSVTNFLERLEEIRLSRGVSKNQLLRSAPELFCKEALIWFRTRQFSSWDQLVEQLKIDFLPYDYEYELMEEIRGRTQGAKEKVITFVSAMENLFNKLGSSRPTEEERVRMIRRNLLPYLQNQLALHQVTNISDLIQLCKAIEETVVRTQKFVPPSTNYRQLLEPGLAYHKSAGPSFDFGYNCSEVASKPETKVATVESTSKEVVKEKEVRAKCWNCNETGHRFRQCTKSRKTFCFRCGQQNTIASSCSHCASKNGSRRNQ